MNLVIKNEHWDEELERALFHGEQCNRIPLSQSFDMFDLLVQLGVFSSRGQARKNWKKTGQHFPPGFNHLTVGKHRQDVWIWVPLPHKHITSDDSTTP